MSIRRTIAVAARKGGVGKTTIACGLASVLSSQGQKVLVVDLDPQSNAAYVLGVNPTAPGTADLLLGENPAPLAVHPTLFVLPGGPDLTGRAIQRLDPSKLAVALSALSFDVVIMDCPPGDEHLERLAIRAADSALVVLDAHPLAFVGADRVIEDIRADRQDGLRTPERLALLLSKVDMRRMMDRGLDQQVEERWPELPRLVVRQDSALAQAYGEDLMAAAPHSRGAEDLLKVSRWCDGKA
jgi:chromosome partitioning protein